MVTVHHFQNFQQGRILTNAEIILKKTGKLIFHQSVQGIFIMFFQIVNKTE